MASLSWLVKAAVLTLTLLSHVHGDLPPPKDVTRAPVLADRAPTFDTFEQGLEHSFGVDPNFNDFNQTLYDGCGFQLEDKHPEEIQGNKTFDDEYDSQFIEALADHAPVPHVAEFRALLKTKNIDFGDDSQKYQRMASFVRNPWWQTQLAANSCPRTQNYGCRSVFHRMACWRRRTSTSGLLGWHFCCPVWPQHVITRIAHCNCCKCAKLSQQGAQCGDCTRRYRSVRIWAVCNARGVNPYFINERKLVPTSCYCKTE